MAAGNWTFLSNHGHVFIALSKDPTLRIRDLVLMIGITERSVRAIISDLEADGYLEIIKIGRRNEYRINEEMKFRHPVEAGKPISSLLKIFSS